MQRALPWLRRGCAVAAPWLHWATRRSLRYEKLPAMNPDRVENPVAHLISQIESSAPRRIIGLAGLPGSGKSTLAARLAARVNAATAPGAMMALGMDGFHFSKAQLRQFPDSDAAFARRGAPWTFDAPALLRKLGELRAGHTVMWPSFEHEIGDPIADAFTVAPATKLILVEGLYLLHDADGFASVSESFDERWFLNVTWQIARERLVARHMKAWNWSRAQAENRVEENDAKNAELVWKTRAAADWWVAPSS